RALEALEVTPPFSTPEEDSYRLYNIGVANEALAYSTEDVSKARTYLQQAAINYGKAIDAKPAEKYFLEPQKRIETAIAHYKRLEGEKRLQGDESLKARTAPAGRQTDAPTAGKPDDAKALTNEKVIAMVKAGVDDETVAQAI